MKGKVYLVGAGPGDKKLITVKGMEKLKEADVIVYDYLANKEFLTYAKEGCRFIDVGKKCGKHTMPQDDINQLLVQLGKEGNRVVRLKGGDPFVFGRGGEEGEVLYQNKIPFEVVPGITSAIGGLAYAGIPITHRGIASSFHVVTGHLKSEDTELDWATLATLQTTLVFLMGIGNIEKICNGLMDFGKDKETPVAIIHRATTPLQKVVVGTLKNIVTVAKESKITAPGLIVIGDVVNKREQLMFFERQPLFGKKIIVTRSRAQSSQLLDKIEDLGGTGISCPVIHINPINEEELVKKINTIENYTHLIFTSQNAVAIFFTALLNSGKDVRALGNLKITASGSQTALELKKYGIIPNFVPDKYVGEEIVKTLENQLCKEDLVLIPRSKNARAYLVEALSSLASVDEVSIYETIKESELHEVGEMLQQHQVDYITFTSSSTVHNFIEYIGKENIKDLEYVKLVAIGPITAKTIKEYGLNIYKQATTYTIDSMLDVLIND